MSEAGESTTTTDHKFISGLQKEIINFEWQINDFEDTQKNVVTLKKQTICFKSRDGSEWHLSIKSIKTYKNLYGPGPLREYIIILCSLRSKLPQQIVHWDIIDQAGGVATMEDNEPFGTIEANRDGAAPILHEIGKFPKPHLQNGALILFGTLTIYRCSLQNSTCSRLLTETFEKLSITELADSMDLLLSNDGLWGNNFSDAEICTEDGTVIPAHRAILVGRSKYFKAIFNCSVEEQRTGRVMVKEINGKAMKALIHFLYTGRLLKDWSNCEVLHDFTRAAHLCQIKSLVEFLDENIAKVCNLQTAGKLLLLCKTLEMKTAERNLRQFIKRSLKESDDDESGLDDFLILLAEKEAAKCGLILPTE